MRVKAKLALGVIVITISIMISTISVVYGVLNKQNRHSVNASLTKTLKIARNDLVKRRDKIEKDTFQLIKVNKVGSSIDYLTNWGQKMGITTLSSTYISIATAIRQSLVTNGLWQVMVYDSNGQLQAYVRRIGDQKVQAGYIHIDEKQGKNIYSTNTDDEAPLSDAKWDSGDRISLSDLDETLSNKPSDSASSGIASVNGVLYIKCITPIMSSKYNQKTEALEPVLTGAMISCQKLGDAFIQEMAVLTGTDLNLYHPSGALSAGTLKAYSERQPETIGADPAVLDLIGQTPQFGTVSLEKGGYFQASLPLNSGNRLSGWMTALAPETIVKANTNQMIGLLGIVYLISLVIVLPAAYIFAGTFAKAVNKVVGGLKDIAQGEGDLTMRLQINSRDEVGDLAKWFNIFIEKLQGIIKDIAGSVEPLSASSAELSAISKQMTKGIANATERSNAVSAAAEEMSTNMHSVAAAMEESATNTNMVATATEQMSATIAEIAKNAEKARGISYEATNEASSTTTNMDQLGAAANAIGKVIETITDISEQVNLLALNATIEAARAGEAGKGFAVVANEIKELAKQTAAATLDIKEKIEGIQGTTSMTVAQIGRINQVINEINDVVGTIATAVEEQSAATKDIASNVAQASRGIQEVNENVNQSSTVSGEISQDISWVSVSMNEMSTSSGQVDLSAQELSRLSDTLKQMVNQFKA